MFFRKRALWSSKKIKKKRKIIILRFSLMGGIIASIILIFSLASHLPEVTITEISINGNAIIPQNEMYSYVEGYIADKYLGLFAQANSLIYPRRALKDGILDTFSEVKNVRVKLDGFHIIDIRVSEHKPSYLWCGLPSTQEESLEEFFEKVEFKEEVLESPECYFLSPEGIIFSRAPYFSDGVFLEVYGSLFGERVRGSVVYKKPLGFYILDEKLFGQVIAFLNVLNARGMNVEKLVYKEDEDSLFRLKNGVEILFTLNQSFEDVLSNLESVLDTDEIILSDLTEIETSLQYIDLRFKGKVFFRFRK